MKRPIPQLPAGEESLLRVLRALKENQEETMGLRSGKIISLATTATNAEIIDKINELIARMQ